MRVRIIEPRLIIYSNAPFFVLINTKKTLFKEKMSILITSLFAEHCLFQPEMQKQFPLGFVIFEQPCQLRDDVEASQKRCNDLLNESKKSVLFI